MRINSKVALGNDHLNSPGAVRLFSINEHVIPVDFKNIVETSVHFKIRPVTIIKVTGLSGS